MPEPPHPPSQRSADGSTCPAEDRRLRPDRATKMHGPSLSWTALPTSRATRSRTPPDWCAVPLSNLDGNALIQTGPLFGDVPDLLRSATGASVVPDASTADSTAYRLTVPMRETALPAARVEGDEVTVWLDDMTRLVRAEFVISLGDRPRLVGPVRSNEATGDVLPAPWA